MPPGLHRNVTWCLYELLIEPSSSYAFAILCEPAEWLHVRRLPILGLNDLLQTSTVYQNDCELLLPQYCSKIETLGAGLAC